MPRCVSPRIGTCTLSEGETVFLPTFVTYISCVSNDAFVADAPANEELWPFAVIMKVLFIILYLLPLFAISQTRKSLTLKFSMCDSRSGSESTLIYWDTIQFYQGSRLRSQIIPKTNHYQWPVEIKDFKAGDYTVTYKNLFKNTVTKLITIPDTAGVFELKFYWDELTIYPINSLKDLADGDSIKIVFSSHGCFHFAYETLIIRKRDNSFIAEWTNGSDSESQKLEQTMIDAFQKFENEIRALKDNDGCTTIDTYIVTSKNWTIMRQDGGCAWNGFYFLKRAIFNHVE